MQKLKCSQSVVICIQITNPCQKSMANIVCDPASPAGVLSISGFYSVIKTWSWLEYIFWAGS